MIMKKEYIKPTTEVIRIQPTRILCFSGEDPEEFFPIPDFGGELG
jgi:hypothetical protein